MQGFLNGTEAESLEWEQDHRKIVLSFVTHLYSQVVKRATLGREKCVIALLRSSWTIFCIIHVFSSRSPLDRTISPLRNKERAQDESHETMHDGMT